MNNDIQDNISAQERVFPRAGSGMMTGKQLTPEEFMPAGGNKLRKKKFFMGRQRHGV